MNSTRLLFLLKKNLAIISIFSRVLKTTGQFFKVCLWLIDLQASKGEKQEF